MDEDLWVEMRFRNETRLVPRHLWLLMRSLEVDRMTFDEAVAAANRQAVNNIVGKKQDEMVREHFARQRYGHLHERD